MIFTIDLTHYCKLYRHQNDNSWRSIGNNVLQLVENDFQTLNPQEVVHMSRRDEFQMKLDGVLYRVNSRVNSRVNDTNTLYYSSTVFRREFPETPSLEQLQNVIANGDDSRNNSLILNVYGNFELRPAPPYDFTVNDPTVIFRNETYIQGNRYVGAEAARDERHINGEYATSLDSWIDHLKTGDIKDYSDSLTNRTVNDMLQEIDQLRQTWVPQY